MDFLSNLIKRPNSIAVPDSNSVAQVDAKRPDRGTDPSCSSTAPTAELSPRRTSPSPTSLITLAMNRCSIDTDLENLFDSAAQELDSLEQQHNELIAHVEAAPVSCSESADKPVNSRETISQLLNEINFNLDQVSAREMEHLQAMSLELSPLAMKPSTTRHSLEQQKALVAAMRSTPQPDTPNKDLEQPLLKLTGLPEFDETKIPELAPLSADIEAELKSDVSAPTLSSTTVKLSDHDYNSDSDVYAECLSLNSIKLSADQSELEAYSSALNEVLEQQLSNATATTLDNTLSEASTAHNDSCEPMDVDDINETMEMLKDVLAPEDHQLLQQQFLGSAIQQTQNQQLLQMAQSEEHHKREEYQEHHKVEDLQQSKQEQNTQLEQPMPQPKPISISPPISVQHMSNKTEEPVQTVSALDTQSVAEIEDKPTHNDQPLGELVETPTPVSPSPPLATLQVAPTAVSPVLSAMPQVEDQLVEEPIPESTPVPPVEKLPLSPPIPTLRAKTAKELEELMALQRHVQPLEELEQSVQHMSKKTEEPVKKISALDTQSVAEIEDKPAHNDQPLGELVETPTPVSPSPPLATLQAAPIAVSPVLSAMPQVEDHLVEEPIPESAPVPPVETLPLSPPIPTHRAKTAKELEELMALQGYAQPIEDIEQSENDVATKDSSSPKKEESLQSSTAIPIASVVPKPKLFPALELNISDSSQGPCSAPVSPTFPVKSPEESPTHFPRSPRAPAERDEMPYLEPAVEQKECLAGVIAKSPLPIQLTVTKPSPEKPRQDQQLNTTIPLGGGSPLNGTFDSATVESFEADAERSSRRTFGVPLDASLERQRRTFSVVLDEPVEHQEIPNRHSNSNASQIKEDDNQLNSTYGMPLQAAPAEQRRTFSVQNDIQRMEQPSMRKTFNLQQEASPAMEATEENIMSDGFEPMDVDVSLRVITNSEQSTKCGNFAAQLAEAQAVALPSAPSSPPLPAQQHAQRQKQLEREHRSSPPLPAQLKRPSIHKDMPANATVVLDEQMLSMKEQLSAGDEKEDVFVEHFGAMSPISDELFKQPQCISTFAKANRKASIPDSVLQQEQFYDADFQDGASNNNSSNNAPVDRSSLLLKFDPLLGAPVPVNQLPQQEQALLNKLSNNNNLARALSPTLEEHETSGSNHSFASESSAKGATGAQKDFKPPVDRTKKHAKMSVDVIDNDCNKTFDNSSLNSEEKTHKYHNMDELEKKIKNEVTRSEDIEKKLKEAEQREEALVKRITEKDKINAKLNGVIEAYEKAIAELIHDKEQLVQNHERQMQEVQADRDANYHHLTSLETTFSDLHVKYEKSKEMTAHLKQIEENLLEEKKRSLDKLRQQEQRYEQMKSHAMQQMEIANKKLALLTKEHADEMKKLKALLKKEEVSRISTAEQLQQKSRENADLLKICEELIYDKGQGGSS
ncbi:PREDICTED: transforming acidic coiled-coil-containing protein 2 isoform X3 [Drosophila arizonae]|uniref:Transforming acidic coiled-coil-containing protein 2 isoform X3 n=1 Tax=Drosophila arizonae TaxID=7263 RepID=A0ABM1Q1T5_DROAR|nr:PREDICTED: transforming acidic coiled-coil-containing protein 2 isoform X3 [Drosophila arizonae]